MLSVAETYALEAIPSGLGLKEMPVHREYHGESNLALDKPRPMVRALKSASYMEQVIKHSKNVPAANAYLGH
jgi:hypothetical protein